MTTPLTSQSQSGTQLGKSTIILAAVGLVAGVLLTLAVVRIQDSSDSSVAPVAAPVLVTTPAAASSVTGAEGAPARGGMSEAIAEQEAQRSAPTTPDCEIVTYPITC